MSTKLKAGTSTSGAVLDADATGILELQTGSTPTTAVYVDASQNVGVGTSSPPVVSTGKTVQISASGRPRLYTTTTGSNAVNTFFGSSDDLACGQIDVATNHPLVIYTNDTERMRIASNGNVGVGVSAPSANATPSIEVGYVGSGINGDASTNCNIMANLVNSSGGWKYAATGKSSLFQVGAGAGRIETYTVTSSGTAGNAVSFTTGPYVANGGTSWTSASDERLKTITGEISDALNKVSQLRAAEYTWKADAENKPQVGLIAQDVQKVLPEVISASTYIMGDSTEYLGVNYDQVVPLLVAAIKELNAKITALEAQLGAK